MNLISAETRVFGLSVGEEIITLCSIWYNTMSVTDRRTDGRTSLLWQFQRLHSLLCYRGAALVIIVLYCINWVKNKLTNTTKCNCKLIVHIVCSAEYRGFVGSDGCSVHDKEHFDGWRWREPDNKTLPTRSPDVVRRPGNGLEDIRRRSTVGRKGFCFTCRLPVLTTYSRLMKSSKL